MDLKQINDIKKIIKEYDSKANKEFKLQEKLAAQIETSEKKAEKYVNYQESLQDLLPVSFKEKVIG